MKEVKKRVVSTDGDHQLYVRHWLPEKEAKGIIQLVHGMVEYIERYDEFARYLVTLGYIVIGHDNLGHGKSVSDHKEWGYFGAENGHEYLIQDVSLVKNDAVNTYGQLPYILFGHSMGSLIVRNVLVQNANEPLNGAIMMGTAHQPLAVIQMGRLVTHLLRITNQGKKTAGLVDKLVFGGFNRAFPSPKTTHDWLSRDEEKVAEYVSDEQTQFTFTNQGYHDVLALSKGADSKSNLANIRESLPILLIAGTDDPVGNFGKNVQKLYEKLKKLSKSVTLKLIPEGRHELLNEINRQEIYEFIGRWIDQKMIQKN